MEKNVIELHLSNLKLPIIENLIQRQTSAALQEDLDDASTMSQLSLEAIYDFKKLKESDCQNVDNIDEAFNAVAQAFIIEPCSATMLRIYCYFMIKKFNIQPM